jgi:Sodium/calcium exchanger protein
VLSSSEWPLWVNIGIFSVAAILVWRAGGRLAGYIDGIAGQTGLGQGFAGMLLLGGITSLPEIATVVTSAWTGNAPLAVNNLLGSASINILLLAIADAVLGREALTSVIGKPATLLQGTLGMILLAIVAAVITVRGVSASAPLCFSSRASPPFGYPPATSVAMSGQRSTMNRTAPTRARAKQIFSPSTIVSEPATAALARSGTAR